MSHYDNAVKIVQRLKDQGHTAYFAGGWVRDHLMGNDSDDIDIATSASPHEIVALFPRTIAVGIAFGVVIVQLEGDAYEVATFRRDIEYLNGRTPSKIEWCAPREDALRRDFTINGMFYDPLEHKIYDYVGGAEDIKHRVIRTIGDPYERFAEDRLRMVRAFRFSLRFGFIIDKLTQEAIKANADTLFPSVAMERVWQEFQKMAKYGHLDTAFIEMMRLDLLQVIFPGLQGMHLNELKANVAAFHLFPPKCSAIIYIAHLFPHASKDDLQEMGKNLRVSGEEIELMDTLAMARKLLEKRVKVVEGEDLIQWIFYFSRSQSMTVLKSLIAHMPEEERKPILAYKQHLEKTYHEHIKRIREKRTLVTGSMLKEAGISPGKDMGRLIKEGERIAVLWNLTEGGEVLEKLKGLPVWPR